jgi:site-specific recombinase XerD
MTTSPITFSAAAGNFRWRCASVKKVTPHKLRHSYATRLLEKDVQLVDIQALLGHESIATTQIYTHAGQERLNKLVADI